MKIEIVFAAFSLYSAALLAQTSDGIRVGEVKTDMKDEKTLNIQMDLVLGKDLNVESNRMMTITPILKDKEYAKAFSSVYVYGRKRRIINERKNRMPEAGSKIICRTDDAEQTVRYDVDFPYEPWMEGAEIVLDKDLCGCGNQIEENSQRVVAYVKTAPDMAVTVAPAAEAVKRRSRAGKGLIQFPVNKTVIYPDYMRNPVELGLIDGNFADIAPEDFLSVSLHGYASLESPLKHNEELAKGRTEALEQYLADKYGIQPSVFTTRYTAEDWEGFVDYLKQCDLADKDELLAIAESGMDADEKEAKIKRHAASYEEIKKNCFPSLRHTDYVIKFKVRPFTSEEARIQIKQDATQLSQREMYDAAQLCERGLEEYCAILTKAVELYPDDAAANLNAAAMEMERGNLVKAGQYLSKADMNTPEAQANRKRLTLLKNQK